MGLDESCTPDNVTGTFITGPLERLSGDDYAAPVIWHEELVHNAWDPRLGKYITTPARTVGGFILFRRGWNDVIHVEPGGIADRRYNDDENAPDRPHESICSQDGRTLFHADLSIDPRVAVEKLDAASSYYFDNRRRMADAEAYRKATAAERAILERQQKASSRKRLADLVRQLRRIDTLTLGDSYSAGNCEPGTKAFVSAVGLRGFPSVTGKLLASKWYSSAYREQDRVAAVIISYHRQRTEATARATLADPPEVQPEGSDATLYGDRKSVV